MPKPTISNPTVMIGGNQGLTDAVMRRAGSQPDAQLVKIRPLGDEREVYALR